MTDPVLNRLYIVIGLLAILAISAAFVVPRFVQWGDYRERMQAIGSEVLGAPVAITGEIEFALLPQPRLLMSDVVVGDSERPVIEVGRIEARFSLIDFLRDKYHITDLVLEKPVLEFAIDPEGHFISGIDVPERVTTADVSVASAEIVDGTLRVADARADRTFSATDIDGDLRLDALRGPFAFQGEGSYGGDSYQVRLTTGTMDADGRTEVATLVRQAGNGHSLSTDGTLATGVLPRYSGTLTYRQAPARDAGGAEDIGRGDLVVSGEVEATPARILLSNYTVLPDENRAASRLQGAAEITLGREPVFNAVISGAALALPPRDATADKETVPYELVRLLEELPAPAATGIAGTIGVDIGDVDLRAFSLRELRLDASTDGETWSIERLAAQLPGGAQLTLSGRLGAAAGRPEFAGELTVSAQRLGRLARLWREPAEGNPLLGTTGAMQARVALVGETLSLSGAELTIGETSHAFEAEIGFDQGTRHFNIEAHLGALDTVASRALLALLPDLGEDRQFGVTFPRGRLEVTAGAATIAGLSGRELAASGTWEGGVLVFDRLAAADLGGAAFDLELTAFGTLARPELSGAGSLAIADAGAPILARLFDAVAAPAHVRDWLTRSLPAELEFRLEAPVGDGGQGLTASGRAGAADVAVQAQLGSGILRALEGPMAVKLEMQSADAEAMTAQLGLGEGSLVPETDGMQLVALLEGTAANSFETTVRLDGGGDSMEFTGSVVVSDPQAWRGRGTLDVGLTDASALVERLGAGGIRLPSLSGTAALVFAGGTDVRLEEIDVRSGGTAISGSLALARTSETANVSGALEVGSIEVGGLLATMAGPAALIRPEEGAWPVGPLDLGGDPRVVSGRVAVTTPTIALGGNTAVTDVHFDLDWDASAVRVRELTGSLGGGRMTLDVGICCAGPLQAKRVSGRVSLDAVDLDALAPPAIAEALAGSIDATAQFSGTGGSVHDVLAATTGEGSYLVEDLRIAGLDPTVFGSIGGTETILELEREALSDMIVDRLDDGVFTAPTASGSFTIAGGALRSPNLGIEGELARLFGGTVLQLADLSLGGGFVMSPGAGVAGELVSQTNAQVAAKLAGTLPAPVRTFEVGGMVDALMVRAYEIEVARLERLRAEDEARQRAAAAERERMAAELAAQYEAEQAAERAAAERRAAEEEEAAAAAERQAAEEEEAAAREAAEEPAPPVEQEFDQPLDLGLPPLQPEL